MLSLGWRVLRLWPGTVHSGPRSLHAWKEENPVMVGTVLCECQPGHSCTDLHANSFPIQPYMLTNLSSGLPPAAGPAAGPPLDAGLSRAPVIPVTSVSCEATSLYLQTEDADSLLTDPRATWLSSDEYLHDLDTISHLFHPTFLCAYM